MRSVRPSSVLEMRRSALARVIESLALATAPVVASLMLLSYLNLDLRQYAPFYSDELHYWNETNTLSAVGWDGGYSVINEFPSRVDWSTFGPHGPGFPLMVAAYASIAGWSLYSPPLFNALWLSATLLVYFLLVPGDRLQRIYVAAFVSTCLPILMYLPTAMQETVHQGIGVIIAVIIVYRAGSSVSECKRTGRVRDLIVALSFVLFALLRASWGVIYVFVIAVFAGARSSPVYRMAIAILVLLVTYFFMAYLYSPVTRINTSELLVRAVADPSPESISLYLSNVGTNVSRFFSLRSNSGYVVELLRYQMLFLSAFSAYVLYRRKRNPMREEEITVIKTSIALLLVTVALIIFFYQVGDWKDYRILAPSMIAATLALATIKRYSSIVALLALSQLVMLYPSLAAFELYRTPNFQPSSASQRKIESAVEREVRYQPGADAWCNTLLIFTPNNYADPDISRVWRVNPGIGVSLLMDIESFRFPIRSRYVFFTTEGKALFDSAFSEWSTLDLLADFDEVGSLYLNSNSVCDAGNLVLD